MRVSAATQRRGMRMHDRALTFFLQKFHDDRCHGLGPRNQEQMAVIDDMQLRIGNAPRQHAHVDQGDQRVVVTGQDQGRLVDLVQPMDAGPAKSREELPVITELARRTNLGGVAGRQARVAAERAAIDQRGDTHHM